MFQHIKAKQLIDDTTVVDFFHDNHVDSTLFILSPESVYFVYYFIYF